MKKIFLSALVALTLTACTGGGNPNPSPDPTPIGWGDASTITAAQLKGCPLADTLEQGKIDPSVNTCTKGTLNGITDAGSTQKCSLTMDGAGTLTFSSPVLARSITLKPATSVYYTHKTDNGVHTVMYSLEDNRYASSGRVDIGFAYYETITASTMPNVTISVQVYNQKAACYTRI